MSHKIKLYLILFISLTIAIFPIHDSYAKSLDKYTSIRIIAEKTPLLPNSEIIIATEITLDPHWHVYWENPGDSGLPVNIEWVAPDGFEFSDISWATPEKISYDGLANYGYYNKVTLLQTLKTPDILPKNITANISMLICNEICIPENHSISINLRELGNQDNSDYIKAAQEKLPTKLNGDFEYFEQDNNLIISLKPDDISMLQGDIEFFPLDWGVIKNSAMPSIKINGDEIIISHERGDQELSEISDLKGLIVVDGDIGYSMTAKPIDAPTTTEIKETKKISTSKITWITAISFAIFGGLILNLMPCVFPILSMKALSLVKMGDEENKHARIHGIAYTLGVILSFIAIGAALIILKEAGTSVGWGFQLQNPIVVAVLAYLLFIIGLNLIGFFEFSFGLGGNIGNKLTQGKSYSSSFFTGTLATIVATPCTAPFMGAAMGFALTQSPIVNISIFAALGFGLALPYLMLSYIPYLRKSLPKPGAWMNTFKQFLAFPMFASAIWLIWVLSQQAGSYGVLLILLGMLAIAFCVWLSHLNNKNTANKLTSVLLIIFLALPVFSLFYIKTTDMAHKTQQEFGSAFSQEKLSNLLEGDDPIFVEMTAAWCITCKANHAAAINIASTRKLFKDNNVQYLIGDWTNHDDKITQYLASFDRNGVPLYVLYAKRDNETGTRPAPIVLPQILTPSTIKEAISK